LTRYSNNKFKEREEAQVKDKKYFQQISQKKMSKPKEDAYQHTRAKRTCNIAYQKRNVSRQITIKTLNIQNKEKIF
jgi:prolyl-tRNA editing enzyme YbaK/EbsC (Cys-tRNA(Pro) deacylase)